jgi:hypothetical protein
MSGFIGSASSTGTFDETKTCAIFNAPAPIIEVACRLGFYGSTI